MGGFSKELMGKKPLLLKLKGNTFSFSWLFNRKTSGLESELLCWKDLEQHTSIFYEAGTKIYLLFFTCTNKLIHKHANISTIRIKQKMRNGISLLMLLYLFFVICIWVHKFRGQMLTPGVAHQELSPSLVSLSCVGQQIQAPSVPWGSSHCHCTWVFTWVTGIRLMFSYLQFTN